MFRLLRRFRFYFHSQEFDSLVMPWEFQKRIIGDISIKTLHYLKYSLHFICINKCRQMPFFMWEFTKLSRTVLLEVSLSNTVHKQTTLKTCLDFFQKCNSLTDLRTEIEKPRRENEYGKFSWYILQKFQCLIHKMLAIEWQIVYIFTNCHWIDSFFKYLFAKFN